MTIGTPGRVGIAITGPVSPARAGAAAANAASPDKTAKPNATPRDMAALHAYEQHFKRTVPAPGERRPRIGWELRGIINARRAQGARVRRAPLAAHGLTGSGAPECRTP